MKHSCFSSLFCFPVVFLLFAGVLNWGFRTTSSSQEMVPILEAINFSLAYTRPNNLSGEHRKLSGSVRQRDLDSLFIQFRLVGNEEVKEGIKNVYIQILDATGKTLINPDIDPGGTFASASERLAYSRKIFVGYKKGEPNRITVPYKFTNWREIRKGRYVVKIFYQGIQIGQSPKFLVR